MKSFLRTPRSRAIIFYIVFSATIGIFLLMGVKGSIIARNYIDTLERNNLETLVSTASTQIDPNKIKNLSGDMSDLENPDYLYLKNQLKEMESANKDARFVYLLGQKDGNIMFLADSEDPSSPSYSYPGEIYYEQTQKEIDSFLKGSGPYTEGPIKDRWGTWVSGLSPIKDENGNIIAQLGFDVDAKIWVNSALYVETLIALIAFVVVLFLVILFLGARRLLVALEREQKLYDLIAQEEANLVSLVENTEDAIWSCDMEWKTITSNSQAKKFFEIWYQFSLKNGIETAHVLYDDKNTFRQEYERVKRGEKFIIEFTKRISNTERWVECAFNPIISNNKQIIGVTVFARDISDRKQVEKFRQELVGFASHELRTPLTGIKWFAELLLSNNDEPLLPKQKETIRSMYRTSEETLRLVKNFLESSKIDRNGGLVVLSKRNNLSYLMKEVLNAEAVFFEKKKISFVLDEFFNIDHIFLFDEEKIRYVLQNLINNAIKYSKDGSSVKIYGKMESENIYISVEDHGIGIPKEDQDKIFDRAYRASNALSEGIEGNGLGLYLVKTIVTAHNGKISFESNIGNGSTFTVRLPFITEQK